MCKKLPLVRSFAFIIALISSISLFSQPVWTSDPSNLELTCIQGSDYSVDIDAWLMAAGNGLFTNGCGSPVLTNNFTGLTPDCAGSDSVLVTFLVTDMCADTSSRSAYIAITDDTAPAFDFIPSDINLSCTTLPDITNINISDDCDPNPMLVFDEDNGQTSDGSCTDYTYEITRKWIATDACGNVDSVEQIIFIADLIAPTFNRPADVTITCSEDDSPMNTGTTSNISDNCDPNPVVSFEDFVNFEGCANNYTIARLWRVTDACGNMSSIEEQTIVVRDQENPIFGQVALDETLDCTNFNAATAAYQLWIQNYGSATATDNCTSIANLTWFAAQPGSYNISNPNTWPGTPPSALVQIDCADSQNGILGTNNVDFVVYDECNGISVSNATFNWVDVTAPTFEFCPTDITLSANNQTCMAEVYLPLPVISEECNGSSTTFNGSAEEAIISDSPGDENVIVNSLTLTIDNIPTPPSIATSDVELSIELINIDGEAASEFFNILLEDGTALGTSGITPEQCGNSSVAFTITRDDFRLLAIDGKLAVELIPNQATGNPGSFGVNDICTGGSLARASIEYTINNQEDVSLTYSVDGGNNIDLDFTNAPLLNLDKGLHSIEYTAIDCAGNENACSYSISVLDDTAPAITCTSDITLSLAPTDVCSQGVEITLPFPALIGEDCSFSSQIQTLPISNNQLITFAYDPNYLEYIAEPKTLSFTNVSANAVGSTVRFLVEVEGDIDEAQEYFLVYGEDGSVLGATRVGLPYVTYIPGSCQTSIPKVIADINIPVANYNEWASDGIVNFSMVPNTDFVLPPPGTDSDGINPICTLFPNGTPDGQNDGQSKISMRLETQIAILNYEISGATIFGPAQVPSPVGVGTHFFNLGESQVTYSVVDNEGNEGSCSFNVNVLDTIPPVAVCQATTIFVNPSGLEDYTLSASEIDAGSTDNCGIVNSSIVPNTFSCDQIGSTVSVVYTVEDAHGNTSSCDAMVAFEGLAAAPSYSVSLCGNDSLFLFTNPPAAQGGVVYTYIWTGPNGYSSNLENPIILNATDNDAGSYAVQIEGITGCQTTGIVEVTLNPDIAKPTMSPPSLVCEGDDLTLFVNIADGESYTWIAPDFSAQTTNEPFLTLNNVRPLINGAWSVNVTRNGCVSPNADPVIVTVEASPNVLAANNGPVCEGSPLNLSSTNINNVGYLWEGPNGFSSLASNPTTNAVPGLYSVTATSINGCSSTANTLVSTLERPTIDLINIEGPPCLDGGTDLELVPNISGGAAIQSFSWSGPNGFSSINPTALIPNATANDNGSYQLTVTDMNGCVGLPVQVVLAQNNIPTTPIINGDEFICSGEDLNLQSTTYSGSNVSYHWFTDAGEVITTVPSLSIPAIVLSTPVQLFVEVDGCPSAFSNILNITVQQQPTQPVITGTNMICTGGALQFETTAVPSASYSWTGPAGFSSNVRNPSIFNATTANAGIYQVQITLNGCISELSLPFEVMVGDNPTTPSIIPHSGVCLDESGASIDLTISSGTAVPGASYTWFEAGTNNEVVGASTSLTANITDLTGYSEGSAEFYVVADVQGCMSLSSIPVVVDLFEIPNESAFAGDNFLLCDANSLTLEASAPGLGSGNWTQISGPSDPLLSDDADPNATLSELVSNQTYVFEWSISNGACLNYDSDEVEITFEKIPQANPDNIAVDYASVSEFNVKDNDQIDILFFIEVVSSPLFGTLVETGEGIFMYEPRDNFAGSDEFIYKVCNQNCPNSCTEAKVTLDVGLDAPCDIPTIFTPNNDGINDSFIIPCLALDDFPNNQISIFNQWGDEVQKSAPYQNDWIGTYNGEDLPVGTYYYVLDFGNGQEIKSGFIILER